MRTCAVHMCAKQLQTSPPIFFHNSSPTITYSVVNRRRKYRRPPEIPAPLEEPRPTRAFSRRTSVAANSRQCTGPKLEINPQSLPKQMNSTDRGLTLGSSISLPNRQGKLRRIREETEVAVRVESGDFDLLAGAVRTTSLPIAHTLTCNAHTTCNAHVRSLRQQGVDFAGRRLSPENMDGFRLFWL